MADLRRFPHTFLSFPGGGVPAPCVLRPTFLVNVSVLNVFITHIAQQHSTGMKDEPSGAEHNSVLGCPRLVTPLTEKRAINADYHPNYANRSRYNVSQVSNCAVHFFHAGLGISTSNLELICERPQKLAIFIFVNFGSYGRLKDLGNLTSSNSAIFKYINDQLWGLRSCIWNSLSKLSFKCWLEKLGCAFRFLFILHKKHTYRA